MIRGWHHKRFRRPLWVRSLETVASCGMAALLAVAAYVSTFVIQGLAINPLAFFAAVVTGAVVTRMIVTAMYRDRVAAPNLTIVLGEAGIGTRPSISRSGAVHNRPWKEVHGVDISPLLWHRRLYRMKFRHKRLLDQVVAHTLYFDADEAEAKALRDYVRGYLSNG
jgi:hypothetical protein